MTRHSNTRFYDHQQAEYWQQCSRSGLPMALILLDVDHFKLYNDHYGHQQGDHCLREVGRCIASDVRGTLDCAARYGGEEFAVLLAQADAEDALQVAERIRADIEQLAMPHAGSPFGHVTISIGLASCIPAAGFDAQVLVKTADRALYQSKSAGRNRVTAHQAPLEATQKLRRPGAAAPALRDEEQA
jgi:diguanylate cyclase (GGDEF)-like protein